MLVGQQVAHAVGYLHIPDMDAEGRGAHAAHVQHVGVDGLLGVGAQTLVHTVAVGKRRAIVEAEARHGLPVVLQHQAVGRHAAEARSLGRGRGQSGAHQHCRQ